MKKRRHPLVWIFLGSLALSLVLFVAGLLGWSRGGRFDHLPSLGSMDRSGNIGVIMIDGVILESLPILEQLKDFEENPRIKAILVRLDSPGGAVGPSQEIYDQLTKMKSKKTIVASMGGIATSGAYYIAAGVHQIVANPGTITGSIGVIMQLSYLEKLYAFLKIEPYVIKSGKFKDVGNPGRKMNPDERQLLQDMMDQTHRQFQRAVADGRGLTMDYVKTFADGRVFSAETAKTYGLVDELGNFDHAVDVCARIAGIKNPRLVYPRSERFQNLRDLIGGMFQGVIKLAQQWQLLPLSPRHGALFMWDGAVR